MICIFSIGRNLISYDQKYDAFALFFDAQESEKKYKTRYLPKILKDNEIDKKKVPEKNES